MSGPGFIAEEFPQACDLCGMIEETRPYGPGGIEVCFSCGMKDPETALKNMTEYLFGPNERF